MDILTFRELTVAYQCSREAVRGISFSVKPGEIVAVVGESGSGKSTLLRAALGLLPSGGRVSGGAVFFDGEDISSFDRERLRRIRGEEIAAVFQDSGAYFNPRRTVGSQYLEMLRYHLPGTKKEHRELAVSMLAGLGLPDPERIMNSYPFQLSGGMRQRAAIAMAMSLRPRLLLADEPTSALDVTSQAQVVREMLLMRERLGAAILLVTHNIGVAARMADSIAVMRGGELKEFGSRDQVLCAPEDDYTRYLLSSVPELEEGTNGE